MYQLLSYIYEASMVTIFYVSVFHPQSVQRLVANIVLDQIVSQACISDASRRQSWGPVRDCVSPRIWLT